LVNGDDAPKASNKGSVVRLQSSSRVTELMIEGRTWGWGTTGGEKRKGGVERVSDRKQPSRAWTHGIDSISNEERSTPDIVER
jgi:hypothetical protein